MTVSNNAGSGLLGRRAVGATLMAALVHLSHRPSRAAPRAKIVVSGASTIAPLMVEIGRRYEGLRSGVQVDIQSGGTSRGIGDVRRSMADIGMVSRSLNENEHDLQAVTIAHDGIAIIVHATNPITTLADDQIRAVYTGEITRWEQVGAARGPITTVNKAEGRSTLELFRQYIKLETPQMKAHIVIGDNEQGVKMVAGNPRAIGYVSIGAAEYAISAGVPLRIIPLGAVSANSVNVANGTYAAARPLNLVTLGPPKSQTVADFLSFASSEKVHDLVREQYFVVRTA